MDLASSNVGGCCAIAAVIGFYYDDEQPAEYKGKKLEAAKLALKKLCDRAQREGRSLVFASLNDNQTNAEPLLLDSGFVCMHEDWAYRDPEATGYSVGVKAFIKVLVPGESRHKKTEGVS